MKAKILEYLKNDHHYWWTVAVLPGIYSLLYLYQNNFTLINSWEQFIAFLIYFIVAPSTALVLLDLVFKKKVCIDRKHLYYCFLIINLAIILSLFVFMRWRWKPLILVFIITIATSKYLSKFYKIGVLLLGLMIIPAVLQFGNYYYQSVYSLQEWSTPEDFEKFTFQKKPNIYLIQPDGYVGKPTMTGQLYNYPNDQFYDNLETYNFNFNHNYRSNYPSTLSSNSTLFNAQHHYFNQGKAKNELFNARDKIMGANPVLRTFKNNGYETNAILQSNYLLYNRPDVFYDYTNIEMEDISFFPVFHNNIDYYFDFKNRLNDNQSTAPQFFFIEILSPSHISHSKTFSLGIEKETEIYLEKIPDINTEVNKLINLITTHDKDGIIIIAADHGGFAGFKYTEKAYQEITNNLELKKSIFNSLLAVKAPESFAPYQERITSSINLFPELFTYLSGQSQPQTTRDASSYIIIKETSNSGVYQYFNQDGESVTIKKPTHK
ncbi:hypothetical protein LY01_02124 [Nonlabens xylanidelens]|uniref:Sulfatase-like protein n=1 Tax=Nonlabens xylanidelens TaxID=191564 RepID=A0A2S6IJS8_9FLAO|nr:hypothetical protein [Nonlabens xylanidelens]PPK94484.1 hypothetical protein LY01_02124 [Nonlabens xylanidelens]